MIDEKAIVACYVDAVAILAMVVLLLQSGHLHKRNTLSLRIYYILSWQVLFTAVACFIFNAMYRQTAPWCHTIALVSRTLWDYSVLAADFLWLTYVDVKLFGAKKRGTFTRIVRILPLIVFLILLIINLFTGIIFTIAEDNSLQPKPLHSLMTLTMFLYFCASALIVWYFDRKKTKVRFLHIEPMIISVVAALIPQYTTSYGTGILGFVIGITLLYFSMIDEFSFLDDESQLYNERFLSYIIDNTIARKKTFHSALILEADGYLPASFEILRNTLHKNNDVIRIDKKRFLMFSGSDSLSALQLLSTHVEEAVKAYNDEHPKEKTRITARCRMRKQDENTYTFLRKVVEEKDVGDPIHGVVSMISELDRLDKELKLAADIQLNALPMNFPAFPDRMEFDLYASMTPAKEVGGDFYDFFLIDNDHLALIIADVSGKGVPAALFMMTSKTLIKNQLMNGCDPAETMERVNLQLCEHNDSRMFVTVWLAVVELSTGKGLACNAGHEDPCIRRSGEDFEILKYRHNIFAGISKKARYQNREFEMHPGDCIFVYTDGVPEANNTLEEMFGAERLTATLNQNPDATPKELIRNVYKAVDLFDENTPQFDDITMLCFKYYGIEDNKMEDI